jgi:hypothetical protein
MIGILTAPFRATWAYVKDSYYRARGLTRPFEEQVNNLNTCLMCPLRDTDSCSVCGCRLLDKVRLVNTECPEGYWEEKEILDAQLDTGIVSYEEYEESLKELYD